MKFLIPPRTECETREKENVMLDLETLGMTQEQLQDRVVNAMCDRLLENIVADEDGEDCKVESGLARRLRLDVQQRINDAVTALADKTVAANHEQMGRTEGGEDDVIEYLTDRAEKYMTEEVSWDGKAKGQDSYQWKGAQTRIAYMVHSHLTFTLDSIIKETINNANASLIVGLQETCKIKLKEIADTLKIKVEAKS